MAKAHRALLIHAVLCRKTPDITYYESRNMNEIQNKYIWKHLLVGLTYLEKDESVREQIQFNGYITAISDNTILFKRNDNGEEFSIPFDKESLQKDDPEEIYKLRSTGEAVEKVDYISSWTIHPPNDEDDS